MSTRSLWATIIVLAAVLSSIILTAAVSGVMPAALAVERASAAPRATPISGGAVETLRSVERVTGHFATRAVWVSLPFVIYQAPWTPSPTPTATPTPTPTATRDAAAGPPAIPHEVAGRENCLQCHDPAGSIKPAPANHAGRTTDTCLLCHKPQQ